MRPIDVFCAEEALPVLQGAFPYLVGPPGTGTRPVASPAPAPAAAREQQASAALDCCRGESEAVETSKTEVVRYVASLQVRPFANTLGHTFRPLSRLPFQVHPRCL